MHIYIYGCIYIYACSSYTQYIYIHIICSNSLWFDLFHCVRKMKYSQGSMVFVSCFRFMFLHGMSQPAAWITGLRRFWVQGNKQTMWNVVWELALGYSTMVLASTTFERSEAEYLWIPILLVEYGSMKQIFSNHTGKTPHDNTCRLSLQGSTPS